MSPSDDLERESSKKPLDEPTSREAQWSFVKGAVQMVVCKKNSSARELGWGKISVQAFRRGMDKIVVHGHLKGLLKAP